MGSDCISSWSLLIFLLFSTYTQPYTYEISASLLFNNDTINRGSKRKKHPLTTFFYRNLLESVAIILWCLFRFQEKLFSFSLSWHYYNSTFQTLFLTSSLCITLSIFKNSPDSSYSVFWPNGKSLIMWEDVVKSIKCSRLLSSILSPLGLSETGSPTPSNILSCFFAS